ncbi:MAG: DUF4292 domain-containing protein [Ferruginibacter sp.]|nr:DUF4292 domain-containing protein [Cytophagales bacterium]
MNSKSPFVFLALLLFFACKRTPVVTNPSTSLPEATSDSLLVPINEVDFQYFSSKSKINYQEENEEQSATVSIRMKKDSLIWLLVNKVGIEGFRALITRDSVYVIDRLRKDSYVKDFKSLSDQFKFTINFNVMQSLVLGNLPFQPAHRRGVKKGNQYVLKHNEGNLSVTYFIRVDNEKLEEVRLTDRGTNNALTLTYANFGPLDRYVFPNANAVNLKYDANQQNRNVLISIETNKAELTREELKFPFNVPKRYEK